MTSVEKQVSLPKGHVTLNMRGGVFFLLLIAGRGGGNPDRLVTVALDAALRPGQGVEGFNLDATQTQRHKAERIAVSPPPESTYASVSLHLPFLPTLVECYLGNTGMLLGEHSTRTHRCAERRSPGCSVVKPRWCVTENKEAEKEGEGERKERRKRGDEITQTFPSGWQFVTTVCNVGKVFFFLHLFTRFLRERPKEVVL